VEQLSLLLQREVIIALAIIGAVIATVGSMLVRTTSTSNPKIARLVLRMGYALTWASVGLFVAAGFVSGWR